MLLDDDVRHARVHGGMQARHARHPHDAEDLCGGGGIPCFARQRVAQECARTRSGRCVLRWAARLAVRSRIAAHRRHQGCEHERHGHLKGACARGGGGAALRVVGRVAFAALRSCYSRRWRLAARACVAGLTWRLA